MDSLTEYHPDRVTFLEQELPLKPFSSQHESFDTTYSAGR